MVKAAIVAVGCMSASILNKHHNMLIFPRIFVASGQLHYHAASFTALHQHQHQHQHQYWSLHPSTYDRWEP